MRAVRSTKLLSFVATAALAGMLGAGCGGGGTSNPCEGIQNACPTEGIHKCSGDTGIQTCEKNADGCLVWSAATQCGDLQTCQATGSDAACRCSNQCPQAGDTQCKSGTDVIQTCTANSYGCLAWVDGTDCATESKYCDDSSEPAVCAESCSDRCTQGETRCNGDVVEGCATAASGCLDWIPGANCADNGQICSDASGTAGCYAPCTDACDTVDATRCQGEAVQTCRVGNDGCKAWVVSEDCSTNNQYCVESGGSASCAATCQDRCPADGDTRCADDETVQTCTTVASGCLDWQKTDECSLPRTKCQVSGGTAQCVQQCQDVCDPNIDDSRCNGTMRQGCQVVAETGCYDWVDLEDCASNGGFCDNSVNPVVCADHCTNECDTLDAKRCDPLGRVIQVCQAGTDGCNDWVTDTDCTANSQVCYDGSGLAKCVDPCESECSTAGATRCNNDDSAVETCELNENNGCNYWNVTTTCAEPTPLCDDSSGDAQCVCTDLCDTDGATQCSGDVIQVCAADGDQDSCLEWKDTTDCSQGGTSTDTCDVDNGGNAVCVCTDECQTGDTACNGNTLQTCVTDGDQDSCLELADTTDCTQGGTSTDVCGDDGSGNAACVCSDECSPQDATQCDGNFTWIQTCVPDADQDSCLEWTNTTDCTQGGTSTDVCNDTGGSAQCVATCTDDCTEQELNTTRCGNDGVNDIIETCQVGTDTCRHWLLTDTCSGDTPACDDSSQPAQCICVDECDTLGGTCNGNVPENCVLGSDGCNDYVIGSDCGASLVCYVNSSDVAACVPACTELLYQPMGADLDGLVSMDITSDDTLDAYMADDFTLASDAEISQMWFTGFFGTQDGGQTFLDATSINVAIYADNAGVPGGVPNIDAPIWGLSLPPNDSQITYDLTMEQVLINLASPAVIPAGTYWLSYWVETGSGNFHYWGMADTTNGAVAMLVNPGGGFGIGSDWVGMGTIGVEEQDTAFGLWSGPQCCFDLCSNEGESLCQGNEIWTCTVQSNGCLDWSMTSTCADPNPFCDDSSGSAVCVPPLTCSNDLGSNVNPDPATPVASGNNAAESDDWSGSCGGSGGLDVCYTWTAPADGAYDINTLGSSYDTVLRLFQDISEIACNDDAQSTSQSQIIRQFTAGEQVIIVVDGYSASSTGDYVLNIITIPNETVCDDFADNDFDEIPDCADPTDCQTLAICVPGAGVAGTACTANTDCAATANDPACMTDADGFGNGYCSEWCWPGTDDCPAGALCMDVGFPSVGLCYDACDPSAPDCRSDTWTDPNSGDNCSYTCYDLGDGEGVCTPQCVPTAVVLTVDSGWTTDTHTSGADTSLFSFTGTAGSTYYIWWDDAWDGSGTYSGDIQTAAYHEDMTTTYFGDTDSGYTTSQPVTIVTGESTVYIITHPYGSSDTYAGQYAIAVSSTNVRP